MSNSELSAPETRREIIVRLEELSGGSQGVALSTYRESCEFFTDDFAFDAPYLEAIGVVFREKELEEFILFMEAMSELCSKLRFSAVRRDDSKRPPEADVVYVRAKLLLDRMRAV